MEELLSYPNAPHHWRTRDLTASPVPFLAIHFRKYAMNLQFFTTLTSLGIPYDITLQELRVESFFPSLSLAYHPPEKEKIAAPYRSLSLSSFSRRTRREKRRALTAYLSSCASLLWKEERRSVTAYGEALRGKSGGRRRENAPYRR